VTPNASAEAVELLNYLHSVSGSRTLAGQHCAPLVGSTRLVVAHWMTGKYPGEDVVDILATDVCRRGFARDD